MSMQAVLAVTQQTEHAQSLYDTAQCWLGLLGQGDKSLSATASCVISVRPCETRRVA